MRWIAPLLLVIGCTAGMSAVVAGSTRVAAPIGETVDVKFQINAEGPTEYGIPVIIEAHLSVLDVLRGAPAWELLQTADPGNASPPVGFDYLLLRVRISGQGSGTMRIPYQVQADHFRIFDAANQPYPTPDLRLPGPSLIDTRIYPDDTSEGWLVFLIDRNDRHPELFFFSGQWFQIMEE